MTLFDVIAGILILATCLNGFIRGATREITGALAFIAAVLLAILSLRVTAPIFRGMMSPDWAAVTAALLTVFALVYIVLRLVGGHLTKQIQGAGALGTLDRTLGMAFGFLRAMVILGTFTLLIQMAASPKKPPAWVADATLYPLTSGAGKVLKAFAPGAFAAAGKIAPSVGEAVKDGAGYSDEDAPTTDDPETSR